jgi:hypothetical protein
MNESMRASRPAGRLRRPKTAAAGRVCRKDDCSVIISRYNTADFCNSHRLLKYPRVRGVVSKP